MIDDEKDNVKFPGHDAAYQAVEGSHFHRKRTKALPSDLRRRRLFLYEDKYPEGQNVQAVVNHFGVAAQVVTGIPELRVMLLPLFTYAKMTDKHPQWLILDILIVKFNL